MPIVRRTDCIKPRVVLAWMCWLRWCGVGTRAELRSARVPTIGVAEDASLTDNHSLSFGVQLPMFRRIALSSFLGSSTRRKVVISSWTSWPGMLMHYDLLKHR